MHSRRWAGVIFAAASLLPTGVAGQEPAPAPPAPPPADAAPVDPAAPADAGPTEAVPPPPVEEPAPAPEPPKATSGVRGRITDAKTGEGLIEATVKVVKGGKGSALTDVDGNYELDLPPGTYELRVFYELYQGRKISGVVVRDGKTESLDVALEPDAGAVQEVVVEGKADPKSEGANLQARKKSAVVQDTVSAQEIARSPDSNAGDAVKRVVSATVVGGKYVFVRGLGGRYSITLLNGVPLPSPDPDNPAVPLDLFPAGLLANLTVVKSYMADLPGTFSGGALLIETNSYPEDFELKLKLTGTFDSESTFRDMLTYDGGSTDALGFDDGTRALPDEIPADGSVNDLEPEVRTAAARSLRNTWALDRRSAYPSWGLSAGVGDTRRLGGGKKLGYLAAVQYGQKLQVRKIFVARTAIDSSEIVPTDQGTIEIGEETIGWGGLGNIGLELDRNHSLGFFVLYSRSAEDRGLFESGFSAADGYDYEKDRLQYSARQLTFSQLSGNHRFNGANGLELKWQGNFSVTTRDEPDTRDLYYSFQPERLFIEVSLSGERQFNELNDFSGGGGFDLSLPFARGSVKIGATAQNNSRDFSARRLGYDFQNTDFMLLGMPPEDMLAISRMGTDWLLIERTQADDGYQADRLVSSAFVVGDYKIADPLRLIVGVRFERAVQSILAGSEILPNLVFEQIDRIDNDILPAAAVVYGLTERMNLRASYSKTLARPQFRELAPFLYYDFTRRRSITGNPELVNTSIQNADVRWEVFPADREVLAVSGFYKKFEDPIELIIVDPTGNTFYDNTKGPDGANVYGLELEARGGFGRFSPALEDFRGAANVTLIQSEVDLGEDRGTLTSEKRALQGQSPYVVNVDLGWADEQQGLEVSVLYNVFARRIAEVGSSGLPDVYESTFHRVDLAASARLRPEWKLKLTGTNLVNQAVVFTQGPVEVQRYLPGLTVGLSLEWAPK